MEKKDVILENFKQALTSTIRSISERNDCNIIFGKQTSQEYKNVNLPEIKKLEDFQDFLTIRAKADSEALRIKHSDEGIFNAHRPKGKIALKLYEIAEKIRYEKIGSDTFKGIKENLSKQVLNLSKNKLNIGLGWQGNPNYPDDEYRSIPFNKFKTTHSIGKFNT